MITITLPGWVLYLLLVPLTLHIANQMLGIWLKHLENKVEKRKGETAGKVSP